MFTPSELALLDEMVGGRYDALKRMVKDYPNIVGKENLLEEIETLRPLVEKIRKGE